jgi:phage-related protein
MVSKGRQAASDLFNAIVNKVREIPGQMLSIGSNIVSGIWNGISNSIGWIKQKVRELAQGVLDGMKSALGIHSPSKVFEQEVGKNMALGMGEGFINAMDSVKKEMQEAIPTNFDTDLNMSLNAANSVSNIKIDSEIRGSGIFGKLDSILSLLEYYIPALQNRQLCLDTGVLVGELTPPINRELARIEMSKERGR